MSEEVDPGLSAASLACMEKGHFRKIFHNVMAALKDLAASLTNGENE